MYILSKVQTEDGYILGLQRIPQGRESQGEGDKRQPILLQHGILVVGTYTYSNQVASELSWKKLSCYRLINELIDRMQDGLSWVLNPPEQSLAFVLADNGFDVWIANTRGTTWSPTHISLNLTDQVFKKI